MTQIRPVIIYERGVLRDTIHAFESTLRRQTHRESEPAIVGAKTIGILLLSAPKMKALLDSVLRTRFPQMAFACGYGSGVFKQAQSTGGKMVDTILVVKDARVWHEQNRERNPSDYAFIPRYLMSASLIERAQREIGGRAWFNTLIPCQTEKGTIMMKYGVISLDDFLLDLNQWETMYMAGRLQKPVLVLDPTEDLKMEVQKQIDIALYKNHENALRASLALLSDRNSISARDLAEEIVGLSYGGDVRVGLAESPTKVKDIALGSYKELCDLYLHSALGEQFLESRAEDKLKSLKTFPELVAGLPTTLTEVKDRSELRQKLNSIVRRSSATQTIKGFLTAGVGKSMRYAASKVGKRLGM